MDKFTWYALNDNVMGGVSTGNVTQDANGNLAFYGKLSKKEPRWVRLMPHRANTRFAYRYEWIVFNDHG